MAGERTVFHLGQVTVEICEGDITAADVDAICNAANNHLWMGSGVAGAIKRRGGAAVEREAMAKGPVEVGSAVETTAGDLPYRYVIHGAVMGQDLRTDAESIAQTTQNCLNLADRLRDGCRRVLPARVRGCHVERRQAIRRRRAAEPSAHRVRPFRS